MAATSGPGLIGALLVGLSTAQGAGGGASAAVPPVDHLHGHVAANFLAPEPFDPPFLCLIASGGTLCLPRSRSRGGYRVLGETRDDAAGEALDKAARLLGLGYPGGAAMDRLAGRENPKAFELPGRHAWSPTLDFSFSGLKTAFVYTSASSGGGNDDAGRTWPPPTSARWSMR